MNSIGRMTRRQFLLISAACGVYLVSRRVLQGSLLEPPQRPAPAPAPDRLLGLLRDLGSARVVGAAYLESLPSRPEARGLAETIVASLDRDARPLEAAGNELRKLVARRVRQDFAEDAIECVEGWIVSRTEARICALAALS